MWPIRGLLGAETDQSASRCRPTPSRHPQNNNHAAEKQTKHEQLRNMDNMWPIYSIKVNLIELIDMMVKYKYLIFEDDKSLIMALLAQYVPV